MKDYEKFMTESVTDWIKEIEMRVWAEAALEAHNLLYVSDHGLTITARNEAVARIIVDFEWRAKGKPETKLESF